MRDLPAGLRRALEDIVGPAHVFDDDRAAPYATDWTGRWTGAPRAVVRPRDTAEVAGVLAVCNQESIAVVPQGGNTGLVGGGIAMDGEVALTLARLQEIAPVDVVSAQVTAGAGVTLADLHAAAGRAGLRYGVDFGSRDTATVGGSIATNAGGVHVVRYGPTRAQVRGVEAVLADGSVLSHLAGLAKDNTGYDLASLLCGSEGTLGVVTAARLQLVPQPSETVVALWGCGDLAEAVATAAALRDTTDLHAAEFLSAACMDLVCGHLRVSRPVPEAPVYALVEVAGPLGELTGVLAAHSAVGASLWRFREHLSEAIQTRGVPLKLDVAVPVGALGAFVGELSSVVPEGSAGGAARWLFGHLLDGNVHVNLTGLTPGDEDATEARVLALVVAHGGSISAEHGVGRLKRAHLDLVRSAAEIAAFRAIKAALDPRGILNPGVLLPPTDPAR